MQLSSIPFEFSRLEHKDPRPSNTTDRFHRINCPSRYHSLEPWKGEAWIIELQVKMAASQSASRRYSCFECCGSRLPACPI